MFDSDFYDWFDTSFNEMVEHSGAVPVSVGENKFDSANQDEHYYLLSYAKVLGTPRLYQFRSKDPSTCLDSKGLSGPGAGLGGGHHYSCGLDHEDGNTKATSFGARPFIVEGGTTDETVASLGLDRAFRWRSPAELGGYTDSTVNGQQTTYVGGGYQMELNFTSAAMLRNASNFLKANHWLDGATRAVVVEFETYNRNAGLFCHVQYILEKPATSGVFVPLYKVSRIACSVTSISPSLPPSLPPFLPPSLPPSLPHSLPPSLTHQPPQSSGLHLLTLRHGRFHDHRRTMPPQRSPNLV
jgi:hypothetical protein